MSWLVRRRARRGPWRETGRARAWRELEVWRWTGKRQLRAEVRIIKRTCGRIHEQGRYESKEFWEMPGLGKATVPSQTGTQGVGSEGRITGKSSPRTEQPSVKTDF